jgi:CBS domain-containing protein
MATGQLIDSTISALQSHAPFDRMEAAALRFLAENLKLAYYAAGSDIVGPGDGEVSRLYLVKKGEVRGGAPESGGVDVVLGAGEGFPIGALVGRRATVYSYRAARDTFCFELDAVHFRALLERSPRFQAFCTRYLASLVDQSHRALRAQVRETLAEERSMLAPLSGLVQRVPEACSPDTPLRYVLQRMKDLRIGSMVVVDDQRRPVGIFTHPDVLDRVALAGTSLDRTIDAVMTPDPVCLSIEAPLFEAALAMARRSIRHVVLVEDGRLAGVVSERDLFSLQRSSLRRIAERIRGGNGLEAFARSAGEIRDLVHTLLAQGFGAEQLTQVVSALNDSLTQRVIEVIAARHDLPGRWCWIALGSEGRTEQTLATDQDNALILEAEGSPDEVRRTYLAFADEVNRALDVCGFPLCKGEIMARNPKWCLSLAEWRATFDGWIRAPEPQALLNASIFFDFRGLAGDGDLAGRLRAWLLDQVRSRESFFRAMAENALRVRPPLGLLRDFVVDDDPDFPGTLDLKKYGARPVVDAARILALSHGLSDTNTASRLRHAARAGALPVGEASAMTEAFQFVQTLRLRHQHLGTGLHEGGENRIDPRTLNELDRRILKEAFRQAAKLQERMKLDYRV